MRGGLGLAAIGIGPRLLKECCERMEGVLGALMVFVEGIRRMDRPLPTALLLSPLALSPPKLNFDIILCKRPEPFDLED